MPCSIYGLFLISVSGNAVANKSAHDFFCNWSINSLLNCNCIWNKHKFKREYVTTMRQIKMTADAKEVLKYEQELKTIAKH